MITNEPLMNTDTELFLQLKPFRILSTLILTCFLMVLAFSCATPIAPSGGEPDREGPEVIETTPETGTTHFVGDEIRFTFDKFVDRNSFRQNVRIEPDLAIPFEVDFRRKTAIVSFDGELPGNTTIIVKLSTDITDTQRNNMTSSYELAVSTGEVIDDGTVTAKVLDAEGEEEESGRTVFLYREPADFSSRANYVAESDTAGNINFGYLSEGEYRAIWVMDQNRNRTWERERESAQPFHVETFELEQGGEYDLGTLYISVPDTVAPAVEGIGLLSERRMRIRLTERVEWDNESYLSVQDTLDNEQTLAWPLYSSENDPNVFFAQTVDPLSEGEFFTVVPDGITDKSGNSLVSEIPPFEGSSEPDTTGLRPISHNSGKGLFPDESLEVTYSKFIDDEVITDSLLVFEGDRMHDQWPEVEVDRHILRISPANGTWEPGLSYEFRVWNPWESEYLRINPEIWQNNQLGSVEVTVENGLEDLPFHLQISDRDRSIVVDTTLTERSVVIDNLPPLVYRAILYQDLNENDRWESGSVDPYQKPEPYVIRKSIPVRDGFTSETRLSFPNMDDAEPDTTEIKNIEINNIRR